MHHGAALAAPAPRNCGQRDQEQRSQNLAGHHETKGAEPFEGQLRQRRRRAADALRDPDPDESGGPDAQRVRPSAAIRRLVRVVAELFGEVALFADLIDDVELRLQPIDRVLLALQDSFEERARTVVALVAG